MLSVEGHIEDKLCDYYTMEWIDLAETNAHEDSFSTLSQ